MVTCYGAKATKFTDHLALRIDDVLSRDVHGGKEGRKENSANTVQSKFTSRETGSGEDR